MLPSTVDPKRILVLTPDAYGGYGGISLYNRDLLSALCTLPGSAEVVAIPRSMPNKLEKNLPRNLTYITSGLNSKIRYLIAVIKVIKSRAHFDMIICGHINLLPIAHLVGLYIKKPVLLVVYGIDVWKPNKSRLTNYLVGKIKHYLSISEHTKDKFQLWTKLDPICGVVIPNAIHKKLYGLGPKNVDLLKRYGLHGKTVLMTLGRLVSKERSKGFDEVLELMPELVDINPDLAYLIVGKGPDRARLEEKAKDLGLEEHIVFTGFVSDEEKADHYRLADAYVMPSRGEGFGFVFLEAMACGIPVVASRLDGGAEAVRDGLLGILVDPNDLADVKHGILIALEQGKNVPDGLQYFYYPNFEQRLHHLINSIMKGSTQ